MLWTFAKRKMKRSLREDFDATSLSLPSSHVIPRISLLPKSAEWSVMQQSDSDVGLGLIVLYSVQYVVQCCALMSLVYICME